MELIHSITDIANVFGNFPNWYQVVFYISAVQFLIVGGLFIHYHSITTERIKQSSALSALENKSLSGDSQSMLELSFSESTKKYEILSSVIQSNPDAKTRQSAVQAISNLKDKRKITLLGQVLTTEKWEVAAACAEALGRSRDNAAIPYLVKALEINVDWLVAQKSAEALGLLEPSGESLRILITALNRGSFQGEAAKQSLVSHGEIAIPLLLDNLKSTKSTEGLKFSVEVLSLVGKKELIPALEEAHHRVDEFDLDIKWKQQLKEDIQVSIESLKRRGT